MKKFGLTIFLVIVKSNFSPINSKKNTVAASTSRLIKLCLKLNLI